MKKINLKEIPSSLEEVIIEQLVDPCSEQIINIETVINIYNLSDRVLDAFFSQKILDTSLVNNILKYQDFSNPERFRRYYKDISFSNYLITGNPVHFEVIKDLFSGNIDEESFNIFEVINDEIRNDYTPDEKGSEELTELFLHLLERCLDYENNMDYSVRFSLHKIPGRVKFTNLRYRRNLEFIKINSVDILIYGVIDEEDRKFLSNLLLQDEENLLHSPVYRRAIPYMIATDEMIIQKVINSKEYDLGVLEILMQLILEGERQGRRSSESVHLSIKDKWGVDPVKYIKILGLPKKNK